MSLTRNVQKLSEKKFLFRIMNKDNKWKDRPFFKIGR